MRRRRPSTPSSHRRGGELELDGIDPDRIEAGQIGPAIDEPSKRVASAIGREFKAARRHRLGLAGQRDVDEALFEWIA